MSMEDVCNSIALGGFLVVVKASKKPKEHARGENTTQNLKCDIQGPLVGLRTMFRTGPWGGCVHRTEGIRVSRKSGMGRSSWVSVVYGVVGGMND